MGFLGIFNPFPTVEEAKAAAQSDFERRIRSALVPFTVDELANEIRRVDGNHSLGAGALAEALMPFLKGE